MFRHQVLNCDYKTVLKKYYTIWIFVLNNFSSSGPLRHYNVKLIGATESSLFFPLTFESFEQVVFCRQ